MRHDELLRLLTYDPATGEFTYRLRPQSDFKSLRAFRAWQARFSGKVAGSPAGHGYIKILVAGCRHYAHRLAWLYVHGEFPLFIDHANGDRADNRLENLRLASRQQNQRNRGVQRNNKLGVKGVIKTSSAFVACITVNRRNIHLGSFRTLEDAARAYDAAAVEYFGEFAATYGYVPKPERAK